MSIITKFLEFYRIPLDMPDGTTIFDLLGGGSGMTWSVLNQGGGTPLSPNNGYFVNTSSGDDFMVQLPFPGEFGDTITFVDFSGNFGVNPCIISGNKNDIMGMPFMPCAISGMAVTIVYSGENGWRISSIYMPPEEGGDEGPGLPGEEPSGGGMTWSVVSGTVSAQVNNGYFVDTSSQMAVIHLPIPPNTGDTIEIVDVTGSFGFNGCYINGNDFYIDGSPSYESVANGTAIKLVYTGIEMIGWKVIHYWYEVPVDDGYGGAY